MANSRNYRVKLRRRREGKTDYHARKAMVVSRRPRLVARPSIRNVTAQIIIAKPQGDLVLVAANSRELVKKYGWKAATGNIPAAYLTGLLCGLKAKAAGIDGAILDIGLAIPTKGSKVFAVLNGVLDAGVEVPHSEEKIVKERTTGEHIAKYAKSLGAGSEEHDAKFSKYTARELAPEKLPEHFSKVKADIVESFKGAKVATELETKETVAPKEKPVAKEKALFAKDTKAPKTEGPEAKVVQAKASPAKKAPVKEKAPAKEKAVPKEKTSVKEKAPAKEKATEKKPTKKGGKKA